MLPIERKRQIKRMIQTNKTMSISELSKQLNVSEMTVYRDIKPLIEEGFITKTFGGISLAEIKGSTDQNQCVYCYKPNNPKMVYRFILSDDRIETACCAHCGLLRHYQIKEDVLQAICHDFFFHTTISAHLAWFVMDTSLNISCCKPQVLTFEDREHAEKFIRGFGGEIYSLEEAMTVIREKMQASISGPHS